MIITIFIRNRQLYYTLWLYIQYFIFIYIQNDKMPILLRVFFSVFIFHSNFYSTFILLGFYTEQSMCCAHFYGNCSAISFWYFFFSMALEVHPISTKFIILIEPHISTWTRLFHYIYCWKIIFGKKIRRI